ncbi:MAG: aspartate carbamoyltransferase catalytic subunit [Actinomycetota bacterium]
MSRTQAARRADEQANDVDGVSEQTADAPPTTARPRHLLSIGELGADGLRTLLKLTDTFVEVGQREIPRVPALRGKTVVSMFFEDSTRTRMSFDTAAKRLSADVMSFAAGSSSLKKGESLRDTVETILAMGVDAMVVRHRSSGAPWQVARWCDDADLDRPVSVLNGGDGWHQHPTQALLDCYSLLERRGRQVGETPDLSGVKVAIVGDIRHSRVARSDIEAFTLLGGEVTLVAPPTLLPPSLVGWPVRVSHDLDATLAEVDVVYLLRLQRERMEAGLLPSLREYTAHYGLTAARARRLGDGVTVMHPGPMNRGLEIADDATRHVGSIVTDQVRNGVATRMAVLFWLLGGQIDA